MTLKRLLASLLLAGSLMSAGATEAQSLEKYRGLPWYKQPGPAARRLGLAPTADPYKGMKKVLFIADQSTGSQSLHDSTYRAMAIMEEVARKNGIALFIRTDFTYVTKQPVYGRPMPGIPTLDYSKGGPKESIGHNLDWYDAVVFFTTGETTMTDQQKKDLISFIKKDGKGFVGIHTATVTGYSWKDYGDMLGGRFDGHPWGRQDFKVIVERPDFPGMDLFVADPSIKDEEIYQLLDEPYSRATEDVLARADVSPFSKTEPDLRRTDNDFPVAWIKNYGAGRVFYGALGHSAESWDDPRYQTLYLDAIKWVTKVFDYPIRPHPIPPSSLVKP